MKKYILSILFFTSIVSAIAQQNGNKKFALVIHGGAGTILKSQMTPEKEKLYTQGLNDALTAGNDILAKGGTALDAVLAAIKVLEDNPLFNAGKGAVFTNEGRNEMDAAIMDGSNLKAGSVAGVTTIKNPITAARAVMDKSEHVMMTGKGAEKFAQQSGCTIVDPSYFFTKERWDALQKIKAEDSTKTLLDHDSSKALLKQPGNRDYKYGTVGCVALDMYGNLAAGTSTGGMTNKKFGRVGDAPIIGAGTYANNATCAISCTGWGEFYIRLVMAKTISDRMELAHQSLKDASDEMIMKQLGALGGDGGMIAIDKDGNIAMPFNTEGMYRAYITSEGKKEIKIYKE
ncbi:isoaspartyl peptidase/L-asparaginase [Panacibacter ginsenosidivorans]|uniref:Isoaspartyl peptidase n=1 Tax=Panacibacter ginsenosidivorans TaxID=1813871 RepID=A0A5B8V4U4_9BACT|nr:isoaspartyl peptidase/L-asparaginase [Panacibacter ginsenosidivorans]QEC66222.1 isoaspartyl peptidase/L-asparaginase [Panacibacter ginsenosidivorans]